MKLGKVNLGCVKRDLVNIHLSNLGKILDNMYLEKFYYPRVRLKEAASWKLHLCVSI